MTIALVIVGLYFLLLALPAILTSASFGRGEVHSDAGSMAAQLPAEIVMVLSVILLVVLLGWLRSCRLTSQIRWRAIWVILPPLLFSGGLMLFALVVGAQSPDGLVLPTRMVLQLAAFVLLVGIFEETLFRGIMFHGLETRLGILAALLLSSLAFGAMHYVNWISGQPFGATTIQVLHAAGGGFLYATIMLRLGSIWPSILLHGFWDLAVSITSTTTESAASAHQAARTIADLSGPELVVSGLVLGFEPIYGLILFVFWWWRRDRTEG